MEHRRIRVLHVVQAAGGVDRYLRMLLKYLNSDRFENIVVASKAFNKADYDGLTSSFEQIEMSRAICRDDFKAIWNVRKMIKKYRPDIVYAHSSKAGAITRVANIGEKNYCIYNPHGWAFNMRCSTREQQLYTIIERIAAHFCEKIICISDAEKKSALDKKICPEAKLQVIYNGVDIQAYESWSHRKVDRKQLKIPDNAFIVGMVGRVSPQKAPDIFVQAAVLIKRAVPSAHFIIVGGGEQEEKIKEYARKMDILNSLHITGWVDNPTDYVELFDVACLAIPMVFGIIGISDNFVPWFFGRGYDKVALLLKVEAPLVLILSAHNFLSAQYLVPSGQRKRSTKAVFIGAGVNFCLNMLLIPRLMSLGAIIASVIGESSIMCIYMYMSREYIPISLVWKYAPQRLVAGALMMLAVLPLEYNASGNMLVTVIQILFGGAVYFFVLANCKCKLDTCNLLFDSVIHHSLYKR